MIPILDIKETFQKSRIRKKKNMIDYEGKDNNIKNAEEHFRVNFFLVLVDQVLMSSKKRFRQLTELVTNLVFSTELEN